MNEQNLCNIKLDELNDISTIELLMNLIMEKYFPGGDIANGEWIHMDGTPCTEEKDPLKCRAANTWHYLFDLRKRLMDEESQEKSMGWALSIVREDGTVLFVEQNLKKFPKAPIEAVLTKQKGKMLKGNLGYQKLIYFRFRPHNDRLPSKVLEVNLWEEEVEKVTEEALVYTRDLQ